MANHNIQSASGFTTLWHLCPNTSKHGCSLGSTGTFACGDAVWPLPNALKAGRLLLPCGTRTPQTPLPAPGHSPRFLTGAPSGTELRNFRLHFTVYTSLVVLKPTPFSPSVVLGNRFLVESPASVFHSFSLLHSSYFQRSTFLALPMHPTLPLSFSLCPLSTKTAAYLPQLSSPPVHLWAPRTCQVLWLEFCRLLC